MPVGPDEQASLDVTALDPAVVETLKGIAMTSLLDRGTLAGSDVARADLAKRAGESLLSSATARAELQARLGTVEAGISNAALRNDSEKSALETARLGLLSVDPSSPAPENAAPKVREAFSAAKRAAFPPDYVLLEERTLRPRLGACRHSPRQPRRASWGWRSP